MKKMKAIKQETRIKRIEDLIASRKWLNNPKYFKTNKVSIAAWDSWAARGQAGGCGICGANYHNATVYNKRHSLSSNRSWSSNPVSCNMCSECYSELEKQVGYEFVKY